MRTCRRAVSISTKESSLAAFGARFYMCPSATPNSRIRWNTYRAVRLQIDYSQEPVSSFQRWSHPPCSIWNLPYSVIGVVPSGVLCSGISTSAKVVHDSRLRTRNPVLRRACFKAAGLGLCLFFALLLLTLMLRQSAAMSSSGESRPVPSTTLPPRCRRRTTLPTNPAS